MNLFLKTVLQVLTVKPILANRLLHYTVAATPIYLCIFVPLRVLEGIEKSCYREEFFTQGQTWIVSQNRVEIMRMRLNADYLTRPGAHASAERQVRPHVCQIPVNAVHMMRWPLKVFRRTVWPTLGNFRWADDEFTNTSFENCYHKVHLYGTWHHVQSKLEKLNITQIYTQKSLEKILVLVHGNFWYFDLTPLPIANLLLFCVLNLCPMLCKKF